MKRMASVIVLGIWMVMANAASYVYDFRNARLSESLAVLAEDHPDLKLNFIYNELDKYHVNTKIHTDDFQEALKLMIGFNPVSVVYEGGRYYIEALQHGRYCYSGKVISTDRSAVEGATVMLLSPKDSTVITYGITNARGDFSIPCDCKNVIGKVSCVGHKTIIRKFDNFSVGTLIMPELVIALKEVKVKAEEGALYSDRSVFLPSSRQRSASNNAYDLLRRMAIPQIFVNSIDDQVSDNAGNEVRVFINGLPAMKEELEGMRTSDVKRVEYLENPTDARFQGASRVINIILQVYEYGGYTRLSAKESFLIGLKSRAEIYSAFSHKKMNYGLYFGSLNSKSHIGGTNDEEKYLFKDENAYSEIYRNECVNNYSSSENRFPVTFQATYNTEKTQIRNMLAFSHVSSAHSEEGSLSISGLKRPIDTVYDKETPNSSNSVSFSGYQFYSLPRDFSISIEPEFRYSRIHDSYRYFADDVSVADRDAHEDAYKFKLDGYVNKSIRQKNTVSMFFWGSGQINRIHYGGDVEYHDRFHYLSLSLGMQYNRVLNNLYFHLDGGISGYSSGINGKIISELGGFTHFNLQCSFNRKNRFGVNFTCATSVPQVAIKSPDILQMNDMLYATGNPDLEKSPHLWADCNHTWLCTDKFWINIFGAYEGKLNNFVIAYEPYKEGHALIRKPINEGSFHKEKIGIKLRTNLLDGNLMIQMTPQMVFYQITGMYNKDFAAVGFNADAYYYIKNLYFQASYQMKKRYMDAYRGNLIKTRDYYSLMLGWSNSAWNIRLSANNVFNKGKIYYTYEFQSQYLTYTKYGYGATYCPQINLAVSYTIGYGKKINRDNEVGERAGAASAIIK